MNIYTREIWKAKEPSFIPSYSLPTKITIHHLCTPEYDEPMKGKFMGSQTMREIQKIHKEEFGYIDIGYHRVIAPNGDIYIGRRYDVTGSHVRFKNTGNIGILVYGNFNVEMPSWEQINSLKFILSELKSSYSYLDLKKCLVTHSDFSNTLCPGKHLSPIVHNLKFGFIPLSGE